MDKDVLFALVPIVVAIGSGLAFIAYKHPREYERLAKWIFLIVLGLQGIHAVFLFRNNVVRDAVLASGAVAPGKINDFNAAVDASLPSPLWILLTDGILLYLFVLVSFKWWLLTGKTDESEDVDE